jgi:hypothetical protein
MGKSRLPMSLSTTVTAAPPDRHGPSALRPSSWAGRFATRRRLRVVPVHAERAVHGIRRAAA